MDNQIIVQTLNNSIKPSIEETERFILYLNQKFCLNIKNDLIINIQDTSTSTKGFFMPSQHKNHYEGEKPLNYICISSLYLKISPYETIAHELAHYINHIEGHTNKGNYHTKHFKKQAEQFYLKVIKGKYGFNQTEETEQFKQMLNDFKINPNAFLIYQNKEDKKKGNSRNLLFMCSCGCKIRTAKNEDKPLKAICSYCNSPFITEETEGEEEGENEKQAISPLNTQISQINPYLNKI
jgi:predicted SprT family Zn-dependent metalloprotease